MQEEGWGGGGAGEKKKAEMPRLFRFVGFTKNI